MVSARDYYGILEIGRDATTAEVKQAFRKLAKRYHPDKNPERAAARRFRSVWRAYTVLRDAKQKAAYDRVLLAQEGSSHKGARRGDQTARTGERAASHLSDIEEAVEVLFQALLHCNYETGISLYEQLLRRLKKEGVGNLDAVLGYEESRDCEFLVAEAYEQVGFQKTGAQAAHYCERAMAMYESLLAAEAQRPCFRHFTREVKERLKTLYLADFSVHCKHPASGDTTCCGDEHVVAKVQALHLPKRETAWIYKKIAEVYMEIHRLPEAREVLQLAFEVYPRLAGAKKICEKLNFCPPQCERRESLEHSHPST